MSEYEAWRGIKKRCFNETNNRWSKYGGRGISMHEDFKNSFEAWLTHVGNKPVDGQRWSIGRIDNNDWYTYDNMRWETDAQQARNHTKQNNNTSGVSGVKQHVTTIAGKDYYAWVSSYEELNGKRKSRSFSWNKYGCDVAKQMAIDFRNEMIAELNNQGADYAKSHGS